MKVFAVAPAARVVRLVAAVSLILVSLDLIGQKPTNIEITNAVQQPSVNRLGINLGDQSYWDSGQLLKNLVFRNPGFEGMMYRSILKCARVTANTCTDDNNFSNQGTGFWNGGSYRILSGNSAGKTGTVAASTKNPNSCAGCGQIITFDQNINASVGDYFVVTNSFPGNGDAGWWDTTQNGATITTERNDLSPETPGKQAVVLNASESGQLAAVTSYFDSYANRSFIQMNGNFAVSFRAKSIGGNNQLYVNVQRSSSGEAPFLSQTVNLTNSWQDYTLTFSANETGSSIGTVGLALQAIGSAVELDDVSLQQTNSSSSNPTAFRDDVVATLKELNPGSIRMMAAGAALGSDLINQIQVPFARYREGFNSSATEEDDVAYGIHEFLQLCQQVGADPWVTIPTATTPQEMTAFIQYLTGTGSDPYSALRIARGQSAPWTSVFNKIHIEFGNETWNGDFKGESMGYPAYPQLANQIFGTARVVSGFQASKFDLVLDGWSSDPGYTQIELLYSTQHDSVDIAPYLLYSLNNESQALQFGAMFAEPEMWNSPGGIVYQNLSYAQNAPKPGYLNVYEVNLGSIVGSPTQAQLDATQPSVGAGIAHADHMLQMMRLGVKYQNAFSLPQFEFLRGDGKTVHLWGEVIDMGTTNRRRPQFLTQALANTVIGGTMLQTVQTGANPTWNQPSSSDGVFFLGAHDIQSFAFNNNGNIGVVLFNLSQDKALGVTLSGANAPSGSVQMSQITSTNITDNNEDSNTVQTTTQSLSGFNPSSTISLPPFSMTVLTSGSNAVQAPSFSIAGGTYSTAQSVTLSDATSGTSIYYTTDGSTPSTNSMTYTAPITVSSSEKINAIAVAPGLPSSSLASASYVIGFSTPTPTTVATPVLSPAPGTYTNAQTVTISDSSPNVTIYYSINGGSGFHYTGPIQVSNTESVQAIAVAAGGSASSQFSGNYTIQASLPPATLSFSNFILHGAANLTGSALQLMNGGLAQGSVAWYENKVGVASFSAAFTVQVPQSSADGFTFTLQNAPAETWATGLAGSGLGYGTIPSSVAIKFGLWDNLKAAEVSETGLLEDGANPQTQTIDMSTSKVSLHSGDILNVQLVYDGTTLIESVTDTVTNAVFTQSYTIDIPATIGSSTAYVGLTAGTGAYTSVQNVLSFGYTGSNSH